MSDQTLEQKLSHALVQYDLAQRCERDDEQFWRDQIDKISDQIVERDWKP